MKLAAKLILVLTFMLSVLLIVDGYMEHGRERHLIGEDMNQDTQTVGRFLGGLFERVCRETGRDRAIQWLEDAGGVEPDLRVRWVWLDAGPGDPHAPALSPASVRQSIELGESIDDAGDGAGFRTYVPVHSDDNRPGALEFSQPLDSVGSRARRALLRSERLLVGLFILSTLTVLLIGYQMVGRPLQKLRDKAERAGAGDLSGPLRITGRTELAELGEALNTMCENLEASRMRLAEEAAEKINAIEMARHADRLRTVGRLASGIAHELGTPLNVVSGRASLIAEGKLGDEEARNSLQIIISQVQGMTEIIRQLLVFVRRRSAEKSPVDLRKVAPQSVAMVKGAAEKKKIELTCSTDDGVQGLALCNATEIQQVLTNLLMNGIQATPDGGAVEVRVSEVMTQPPNDPVATDGRYVCVSVRDTGVGIEADDLPHVFEPFFTTKGIGEGTGLGLSIVHGILEDHSGWVAVDSTVGVGSCFTIYLPTAGGQ